MNKARLIIYQIIAYTFFMGFIAYFSSAPDWAHSRADEAMVKVSIRHPGKIVGECRNLSEAEMGRLSPNMKVIQECPRERSPVTLTIDMDGKVFFEKIAEPSGLQKDGVSTFYGRFNVPAGEHKIKAVLQDDANAAESSYKLLETISLKPRQVLVIDFKDGFILN